MTPRAALIGWAVGLMVAAAPAVVHARPQTTSPPTQAAPPPPAQTPPPQALPRTATPVVTPEQTAAIEPFQKRVERAGRALDTARTAALESLDHLAVESVELRKTRALTPVERPVHRQLFILRARGHLKSRNNDSVEQSYRELLHVDPFYSAVLPPREQEALDALKTREGGVLEVASPVRDCRILIDGIDVGITGDAPVRVSLVAGTYQLRLEKPTHAAAMARVVIVAAQTTTAADLAPRTQVPPIVFLTDRAGITVIVDNVPLSDTVPLPGLRNALSPEAGAVLDQAIASSTFDAATSAGVLVRDAPVDTSFNVRFRGECFIEETRPVSLTAEALAGLAPGTPLLWLGDANAVRMRPDVGTMRVTSTPTDADVYLDGKMAGRTPFERSVCSGEHRVRVRHAIGSYTVTAVVIRGRTEVLDVALKPGLAFLGAVEADAGGLRPSGELTSTIDRTLAATVRSFRLAAPFERPAEVLRWTDQLTADLVAAADRGDADSVKRLLKVAYDNYDAPLLLAGVSRAPAAGASPQTELLLFWHDRAGADRIPLAGLTADALVPVFERIDRPADGTQLVYQNDLGMRVVDTSLPEAPLLVVAVDVGSPATVAGVRVGDALLAIDGSPTSAAQLAELLRQKRPGDVLALKVPGTPAGAPARQVSVPVQRRPRRAPAFDPSSFGNSLVARLQAAAAIAAAPADRALANFNLALVHMRFREWRQALELLSALGQLPTGVGVGPGAALFFRARCHEELGEMNRAVALYREAASIDGQPFADDGASVATLAKLRLSALGETPRAAVVK
ncbi:MAG: PEGA domain-containing protein [Acidobacteriota bacterium]